MILVGFAAGFINTIAGGGTLLTMPMLIFMGLPSNIANATNRVAILIQTALGVKGFQSKGVDPFPFAWYLGVSALLGSFIGAYIAVDVKGALFNRILSIIMLIVVVLMIFQPKKVNQNLIERINGKHLVVSTIIFFFLGIYGGFINAGIGFMMLAILPYINRLSIVKSNAVKVAVVCCYTVAAVIMFQYHELINWKYGLILAIGNASGAWVSSRWSVGIPEKTIKYIIITVICAIGIKLWFFSA
ncbi:sulfite exporter TauE/SafE family protein [Pseudofulvibacter geojedonensis]|uniref:Probable membrane transporter protein n=1 Tax=Pseudofulvibacter geojedonensis TaxID=1123758 RepID=A0ABW3I2T5_9FLAO